MSSTYLEQNLSDGAKDLHRALASMQEELEAVDYYSQRAETATDPELKAILMHNGNEEIEHATMLLEWIRRKHPGFDGTMKKYLFTTAPLTAIEGGGTAAGADQSLQIGKTK